MNQKSLTTPQPLAPKSIAGLLLIIITISTSCQNSINVNFYELALREAKKQNKLILLDFSAEWCGGCKAYDKYVFQDSLIYNRISDQYLLLKINKDLPDNEFLNIKYEIGGIPHIVIIDSDERILGSISGFYAKYADKPDLFLTDLTSIINSQEKIKHLETVFNTDTTNIEAATSLLTAYQSINQYIAIQRLNDLLVRLNPTPERLFEHQFNRVIYILQNERNADPLLSFIQDNPNMDYNHKWGAFSQLLYYYRDNEDIKNQDKYYLILMKLDPDYFKHHYIEFLYENKLKTDTAIFLTDEYNSDEKYRNTFWGQYLNAHKLSSLGEVEQAVKIYSAWMESNKLNWESGDNYWSLFFYAQFAEYHNVDLERALKYIQIAERNRNMPEEKVLMGRILYKLGRINESLEKLQEALNLVESQNEYYRISKLIKEYKETL